LTAGGAAGNSTGVTLISGSIVNVVVTRCDWDNTGFDTPGQIVYSGGTTYTGWSFTDCTQTAQADHAVVTFMMEASNPSGGIVATFLRHTVVGPRFSLNNFRAGTTVTGSSFTTSSGVPFLLGADADSGGATTSVTVTNCNFSSTGTHAILIAHGSDGSLLQGCNVLATADYGLVFKSCTSNTARYNRLLAGAGAGKAALYFKGSIFNTATHNTLIASGAGRCCVFIGLNDALTTVSANVITHNTFICRNGGGAFNWVLTADNLDNVVDRNLYSVHAQAFGTIGSAVPLTLGQLRMAWNTAGDLGFDAHSRTVHKARHHGMRNRRQRLALGRSA
jgi:hypothetical protein